VQVHRAFNVEQARSILANHTPDLILTDIMMPGVDGLTFLRGLCADPKLESVPKIAISAMAMKRDREQAERAGADGYLVKPFSAKELQDAIRPYLNGAI
jgi:two-component system cell cycle response regulator DivK